MAGFHYGLALVPDLHRQTLPCSAPRCPTAPAYYARYEYVTGRQGRITTASRYYCAAHAATFATTHQLVYPPTITLSYRETFFMRGDKWQSIEVHAST